MKENRKENGLNNEKNNNKKQKKKTKKKYNKKKILKRILLVLTLMFLSVIIMIGCLVGYVYIKNKDNISKYILSGYTRVSQINDRTFNNRYSTKILDKDKKVIKELKTANYIYKKYGDINSNVFDAFVSIEDERYYSHSGIDFKGLMRAGIKTITSKGANVQGGSTITQQLVKNVFLTNDRTVWRKLEEMVIAQELEKKYSKENILEFYVNNIYFGYGNYGIETASNYFFQKPTKDLNLGEIALLVGIPNNPTVYDPINNYDNANKRKNIILEKMFELERISEEEKNKYQELEIKLNVKKNVLNNTVTAYEQDFALKKAIEVFMKDTGFSFKHIFKTNKEREEYLNQYNKLYAECRDKLISGGYIIETSIDPVKQKMLQDTIDRELSGFTQKQKNGIYKRQGSSTIVDNTTGEVVAIVGGRTQKNSQFNRASIGARQPGSTLKPITSFTPAFEVGYFPESIYNDKPVKKGPNNWYKGYKGNITLRYATEISANTIPYRLADEVGMDNVLNKLKMMDFRYLTPEDKNPIISVGGMTRGVTTTELSGAYSTLARNGEFIEPTNVRKITKLGTNEVIYENEHLRKRVYNDGASYLMTDTLKGVLFKPHGTGKAMKMNNGFKNQVAKTGTTDNNKDLWSVGYTPYYTVSVWVGEDTPTPIYSGLSSSKNIWRNVMTNLHKGLKDKEFEKPKSVYSENGKLKVSIPKENDLLKERKEKESNRKLKEIAWQNERLSEFEYRIKYGLSEEEENLREVKAENAIKNLERYEYLSLNQERELRELIASAKKYVDDVKRKSAYIDYTKKLNSATAKLESKHSYYLEEKRKEEARLEEERRKEEERLAEEKRLEEERLEEERRKEEEEKRKEEEEQQKEEQEEIETPTEPVQ